MRILPVGGQALLVELDDPDAVQTTYQLILDLLDAGAMPRPTDVVPAARTVLLDGVEPTGWRVALGNLRDASTVGAGAGSGRDVVVPVTYDGADLAVVAEAWGCDEAEVVQRHRDTRFTVAFCGFAPGFAYCSSHGALPGVPRRESPRTRVPAGSVALAGEFCGIYPRDMPGGWQLVGRTDTVLFDPDRDEPALLRPGDLVRFEAASSPGIAGRRRQQVVDPRPPSRNSRGSGESRLSRRGVRVVETGPGLVVQDLGRPGWAHIGVPRSGALDPDALALANRLVGNPEGAAGLEVLLGSCVVEATGSLRFAVTGTVVPISVDGRAMPWGDAVSVRAGQRIEIGRAESGLRCWVGFGGGLALPDVLGSRSTDTLSSLGPLPLAPGDELPLGATSKRFVGDAHALPAPVSADVTALRFRPGPRLDWFMPNALRVLTSTTYTVSPDSDRVGLRLAADGGRLERRDTDELPSEGMVRGSVQVPTGGQPLILLADHPVTGGYPVAGVVEPGDLARCAQLRPGSRVRFTQLRESRHG